MFIFNPANKIEFLLFPVKRLDAGNCPFRLSCCKSKHASMAIEALHFATVGAFVSLIVFAPALQRLLFSYIAALSLYYVSKVETTLASMYSIPFEHSLNSLFSPGFNV